MEADQSRSFLEFCAETYSDMVKANISHGEMHQVQIQVIETQLTQGPFQRTVRTSMTRGSFVNPMFSSPFSKPKNQLTLSSTVY
jgi:hypothetical protein